MSLRNERNNLLLKSRNLCYGLLMNDWVHGACVGALAATFGCISGALHADEIFCPVGRRNPLKRLNPKSQSKENWSAPLGVDMMKDLD